MGAIDPVEFGELKAEVRALRRDNEAQGRTLDRMAQQIDELLSMANRSKGALWVGMSIAGTAGGLLTWLGDKFID